MPAPTRPCAYPGCRAWAMRGEALCRSHRGRDSEPELRDERRLRAELFAETVRAGRHGDLIEEAIRTAIATVGHERSLGQEIGALRLMLQRVVAVDALEGDPREVTQTMTRLVDAIVRAMRMERTLSGDLAGGISEALTTILTELGLGEERR